jgi:uronate dehydrogenase
VICQRIGVARPTPQNARGMLAYLSERDYGQLTEHCIEAPNVHFLVVYGVSANSGAFWDNAGGRDIGFVPQDHGEDHAAEVARLTAGQPEGAVEPQFQGGWFCGMEFFGATNRIK